MQKDNDETYLRLSLVDSTGKIEGVIWSQYLNDIFFDVEGNFIKVSFKVKKYKEKINLEINNIRILQQGEFEIEDLREEDFYPSLSREKIDSLTNRLNALLVSELSKPHYIKLREKIFTPVVMKKLQRLQGGKHMHHAYIGGWLEHTVAIMDLCIKFCDLYIDVLPTKFDRELLILAASIHDLGKLKEYKPFPENIRTDEGILIGHVNLTAQMLYNCISAIDDFPKKDEVKLLHCIHASHGSVENQGYDRTPKVFEAIILAYADAFDAKISLFNNAIDSINEKRQLGENRTHIYYKSYGDYIFDI